MAFFLPLVGLAEATAELVEGLFLVGEEAAALATTETLFDVTAEEALFGGAEESIIGLGTATEELAAKQASQMASEWLSSMEGKVSNSVLQNIKSQFGKLKPSDIKNAVDKLNKTPITQVANIVSAVGGISQLISNGSGGSKGFIGPVPPPDLNEWEDKKTPDQLKPDTKPPLPPPTPSLSQLSPLEMEYLNRHDITIHGVFSGAEKRKELHEIDVDLREKGFIHQEVPDTFALHQDTFKSSGNEAFNVSQFNLLSK